MHRRHLIGFLLPALLGMAAQGESKTQYQRVDYSLSARPAAWNVLDSDGDGKKEVVIITQEKGETISKKLTILKITGSDSPELAKEREIELPPWTSAAMPIDILPDPRMDWAILGSESVKLLVVSKDRVMEIDTGLESVFPASESVPMLFDPAADLNGDGLDDLPVLAANDYHVYFQNPDGGFEVDISVLISSGSDTDSLTMSKISRQGSQAIIERKAPIPIFHSAKVEGAKDLYLLGSNSLIIAGASKNSQAPVQISRHKFTLEEGKGGARTYRPSTSTIQRAEDLNGDGRLDLIISHLGGDGEGDEVFQNQTYLFLSRKDGSYPSKPDSVLSQKGQVVIPVFLDVNGDSRKDLLQAQIQVGVKFFLNLFLFRKVSIQAEVFLMSEKGGFAGKPSYRTSISIGFRPNDGQPTQATGDFDGDGREDILFGVEDNRATVYLGQENGKLRERRDWFHGAMGRADSWVGDINDDNLDDVALVSRTSGGGRIQVFLSE